jgi:uncharacterized LabA/DUF88 family protein
MKNLLIIDGYYLTKSMEAKGLIPDFFNLLAKIESRFEIEINQKFYFDSSITNSKIAFYKFLRSKTNGMGMDVRVYGTKEETIRCQACGNSQSQKRQAGVDVGMAVLAIMKANTYDNLILLSGDGDLKDAISYLVNDLQKGFYLVGFKSSISPKLKSLAKTFLPLEEVAGIPMHKATVEEST